MSLQASSFFLIKTNESGQPGEVIVGPIAPSTVLAIDGAGVVVMKPFSDFLASSQLGANNGVASLDGGGKLVTAQIPSSILGALNYQGTWNAATNSPAIPAAASGNKGYYYKVATAGTTSIDGVSEWAIGDFVISNGTAWDKVDNTEQVEVPKQTVTFAAAGTQTVTLAAARHTVVDMIATYNGGSAASLRLNGTALSRADLVTVNMFAGQSSNSVSFVVASNAGTPLASSVSLAPGQMATAVFRKGTSADTWSLVSTTVNGFLKNIVNHTASQVPLSHSTTFAWHGPKWVVTCQFQPYAGDTFSVSDGTSTTTFWWDDGSTPPTGGETTVMIGSNIEGSLNNAISAVASAFSAGSTGAQLEPHGSFYQGTISFTTAVASASFDFSGSPGGGVYAGQISPYLEDLGLALNLQSLTSSTVTWTRIYGAKVVVADNGPDSDIALFIPGLNSAMIRVGLIPANTAQGVYDLATFFDGQFKDLFSETFEFPGGFGLFAFLTSSPSNAHHLNIFVEGIGNYVLMH
jgi:hypothetical protein